MSKPIAYNPTHATIAGTTLLGDLSIGTSAQDYSTRPGGLSWWNSPSEATGYIIGSKVAAGNQPTPLGNIGTVQFWGSGALTDASFVTLVNKVFGQTFIDGGTAKSYLTTNGHWTNWVISPPAIITDGNTYLWYDSTDLATITKDGSNAVSVWTNKIGNGANLSQGVGVNQPLYTSDGIVFDGSNDFLSIDPYPSFAYKVQPLYIYMAFTWLSYTQYNYIFAGGASQAQLAQDFGYRLAPSCGTGQNSTWDVIASLNTAMIVRVLYNNPNCSIQLNNGTPNINSWGANGSYNMAIGGKPTGSGPSNIRVNEFIMRTVADNSTNSDIIYNYLKSKYSL